MSSITRRRLQFTGPGNVEIVSESLPAPEAGEVRVQTVYSAVSPGTESLVYRGEVPTTMAADPNIEALSGDFHYPFSYGYAAVGRVDALGEGVSEKWEERRVFSFQPHTTHFTASIESVIPLPDEISFTDGVMIPSVETAVNLVMDAHPVIGERGVVFGQGIIGLLTTDLLARFPLNSLYTVEPIDQRRDWSLERGADRSFSTEEVNALVEELHSRPEEEVPGADVVIELSGVPGVLNQALEVTGFDGRIIVGSWYGTKEAPIRLGERFHRSRITISSSQVSTVAPKNRGRWTKARRMHTVLDEIPLLQPGQFISDTFSLDEGGDLFQKLHQNGSAPLQPVFRYE